MATFIQMMKLLNRLKSLGQLLEKNKSDDASLQPAACDATVYAKFFILETFQV